MGMRLGPYPMLFNMDEKIKSLQSVLPDVVDLGLDSKFSQKTVSCNLHHTVSCNLGNPDCRSAGQFCLPFLCSPLVCGPLLSMWNGVDAERYSVHESVLGPWASRIHFLNRTQAHAVKNNMSEIKKLKQYFSKSEGFNLVE